MNKQNKISLILGVLVLTVLIISSSFAFFQITNTGSTETNTTLTGNLEDVESYGTASLSGPNNKLHIKIKASDMAPTKIGTHYYATINPDLDYELEKQNHLISTASIDNGEGNEDVVYECTSDLLIEASGSLVTDNIMDAADGNIYFGGKGSTIDPTEISLKDIIDAQVDGGYKKQIKYKITGNGEATLTTDIDIINRNDYQNDIAGKEINLTITNKNLVCTVKGLQEKTYMKALYDSSEYTYVIDEEYIEKIENVQFVANIPSEEELNSKEKYWDLSDNELSPEKSVIGWIEKSGNKGQIEDENYELQEVDLYNLYIGSESEIYAKNLSWAFSDMTNLKEINFDNLNTSETTDMSYMFDCYQGTTLDLSTFDTSKVTDMSGMFDSVSSDLPFKDWPNFVTNNVEDMSSMFYQYEGSTLDLSTFDTSSVTDMSDMFNEVSIDLPFKDWPNFVTSTVTNMSYMFRNYKGADLDLSTFNTSEVTDMSNMFYGTSATIKFPQGFGSFTTDMSSMFYGYNGSTLDLSTFDTSRVRDMRYMFSYASVELPFREWPNFVTDSVINMGYMFDNYQGTELDLSNFNTSEVIYMNNMFSSVSVDLSFKDWLNFVTTNVKDMSHMFSGYKGTTLDLSNFDTSKVTDMSDMFEMTSVDLPFQDWPKFVTTNVKNMRGMFYEYEGTTLDLSTFDTSSVTDMSNMFYGYDGETLDLSSFTFDKVNDDYETFSNVSASCEVKIKSSQQEIFESKFPYNAWTRPFTPSYVD